MICSHTIVLWDSLEVDGRKLGVAVIKHDANKDIPKIVQWKGRYFIHAFKSTADHFVEAYALSSEEIVGNDI